ncbi:MAG: translocation/assembly module TamB domain-containing protein [Thermoanaerobaculia bacterium]
MVRPAMWTVALAAVALWALISLVQGERFGSFVARQVEQAAEAYLEREVAIGALRVKVLPLGAEIDNFRLGGPEPEDPPFAEIEQILIDADITDFRHPHLYLHQVKLIGPRIFLDFVGKGVNNLPRGRKRKDDADARPRRLPLKVTVRYLALERGFLELRQQRLPMALTAESLTAEVSGNLERELQGSLSAPAVEVSLPKGDPIVGALNLAVELTPTGLELKEGRIEGIDLNAAVSGYIGWEGDKEVVLELEAKGDTSLFRRMGYIDDQIQGPFELVGGMAWRSEAWGFRGQLDSRELVLLGRPIGHVRCVLSGDRNGLQFDIERADYGGGAIRGAVNVDYRGQDKSLDLDLLLDQVQLQTLLMDQHIPVSGLSGTVSGVFNYRFPMGDADHGQGWGDLKIAAKVATDPDSLPVEGTVPLIIENGIIRTRAARITTEAHEVTATGYFDIARKSGQFEYQINTIRLAELLKLLPLDQAAEPPLWLPTSGQGEVDGTLIVGPEGPSTQLQLALRDVEAPGFSAELAQGRLLVGATGIEELWIELLRPGGGLIVTGRLPFPDPRTEAPAAGFSLALDASKWPMAQVHPWLPFELDLDGALTGSIVLSGDLEHPEGDLVARIDSIWLGDLLAESLTLDMAFDPERVVFRSAVLTGPPGQVDLSGSLDLTDQVVSLQIASDDLDMTVEPLISLLPAGVGGTMRVSGVVGGTLDEPEVTADLTWRGLSVEERLLGEDGSAELHAHLEGGDLKLSGDLLGLVTLEGGGRLTRQGLSLSVPVRGNDMRGLVSLSGVEVIPDCSGEFKGVLSLEADFGTDQPWSSELALEHFSLELADQKLTNLEPVVMRLSEGGFHLDSFFIGDPASESELFLSGDVAFDEERSLDMQLQSSLETTWLTLLLPDLGLRAGRFDVLAEVRGTMDSPRLDGQGTLSNGQVIVPAIPHALDNIRGQFLFYPGQVVIDSLQADLAGGQVRASGLLLPISDNGGFGYQIQIFAENINLRFPEGWLSRGDAELSLASTDEGHILRGNVRLDRAYYVQDIKVSMTQMLRGLFARQRVEVDRAGELQTSTQLNIVIDGPGALRIRNNLADMRGDIDLVVRGTVANPVLFGRVEIERGGTVSYSGTKYTVGQGLVTFANPFAIEPVIDLAASARVREYRVTMSLFGTLDNLNANFSSDPPLADLEVLSLLTTGETSWRGTRSSQAEGETEAAMRATGLLYGQAASMISERTSNLFGFDRVRLEPLTTSSGDLSSARVTVGKQVSRDIFLTYSYDPSTTEEQIIQVEWVFMEGTTLVLTQDGDGSYSADVRWEKTF